MSGGIIKPDRVVQHIPETVQALRVRRVGNNAVRLQEAVDIRRNPPLREKKNKLLKFREGETANF
jgi:hypothetical protein